MLAYLNLIHKTKTKAISILDLSNRNPTLTDTALEKRDLTELPQEVLSLSHLEELNLAYQSIVALPENLTEQLPKLRRICLYGLFLNKVPDIYGLDLDWEIYLQFKDSLNKKNIVGIRYHGNNGPGSSGSNSEMPKTGDVLKDIIKELPHLQYLSVTELDTGLEQLPAEIGNLSQLKELNLANNTLSGLPKGFEKLQNIEKLDISNNLFNKLPKELLKLPTLKHLFLSDNFFQNPEENFEKLVGLESLDLSRNGILSLPKSMASMKNLKNLQLCGFRIMKVDSTINFNKIQSQFKGQIKAQLEERMVLGVEGPVANLVNDITNNNEGKDSKNNKSASEVFEEILPIIASIPVLENLDISGNNLQTLPELKGLHKLKSFNIADNSMYNFPESLVNLKALEFLNISNNYMNWEQDILFSLSNLKILYANRAYSSGSRVSDKFSLLQNLEEIYFDSNNFSGNDFISSIFQLPNLEILVMSNAALGKLPDSFAENAKIKVISLFKCGTQQLPKSIGNLKSLYILDLSENPLSELPTEIGQLEQLEHLNLYNNELLELPQELCELSQLKSLNISSNKLNSLPKRISRLTHLRELDVSDNHLSKVPASISFMPQLHTLNISSCGLRRIPKEVLLMPGTVICNSNPLISPPTEITERGKDAIITYFEELERQKSEYIYEAKLLIVGSPGAGKTTLRLKLIDANCSLPTAEDSTDGIDVETIFFDLPKLSDNNRFRINIWDFGGQELYHSTHQFFFTRRSLYVLVLNTRRDDDRVDYWLHTLRIFGGNSPVIILQNQEKDRSYPLNEQRYRSQYPNIKEFISVNLSQAAEIPKILQKIRLHIQELSHIGQEIPSQWMEVRQELASRSKTIPYIDFEDFIEICNEHGIEEEPKILVLSSYLHDLGALLHFSDNRILKKIIFLSNNWVIDAAYRVLDNDLVKNQQGGRFFLTDLDNIWVNPEYKKVKDELLELMIKFEICFQIPDSEQFIVPQLLPPNPPDFEFPEGPVISLRYQYEFMPRGLLTRFIVHMHHYIGDHKLVWKEGVVLDRLNTFAKIFENYDGHCIEILIGGERIKEMLAIITDEFEHLHHTYPQQLAVQKLIPCNCALCLKPESEPFLYDYQKLCGYLDNGRDKAVCDKSFKDVTIQPLLDGIKNPLLTGKSDEVKILFLAANPKNTQALDLDKEVEMLRDVVESGRHQDRIQIDQRWEVSFDKLQQTILKFSPQLIHFSGHGIEKGLLFEDENGMATIVSAESLASLFAPMQKEVVCVILNACYSEHQAKVIGQHIPFVVGMNTAISDEAALLFTRGFYRGLANRLDVEFAFSMGLSLVQSERPDQVEIFVLWKEGQKFN